jgi:12-oxophytodienoic acid reductase
MGLLPWSDGVDTAVVKTARDICEAKGGGKKKQDKQQALLTPYQLGPFHLAHRIVHAPLTRCRAPGGVPLPETAVYYAQRSTKQGLLISEAAHVMPAISEYPNTPGIFTPEQVEGWKAVVKAVHEKGAVFFCQIWHSERISQSECVDLNLVEKFRIAARNAISAGFDGVEIHGAHGHLLGHNLIRDRNDMGIETPAEHNHCRGAMDILQAVAEEIGGERVGFRISPYSSYIEDQNCDQAELGLRMAKAVNECNILYASYIENRGPSVSGFLQTRQSLEAFRKAFKGTFIAAGGYTREVGNSAIESGRADLIAFGRLFLCNPDLPKRFELDAPLNKYDRGSFYTSDRVMGYIDYPTLEELEELESPFKK